jgi:D-cysteine desulfhydrase family pyridoxal phosphate-dependent enzyme
LYVKRDDLTGLAFGGNKTRKLEFLMADARAQGARTVLTTGAIQSNHCRQTAAAAARLGYECVLILAGEAPDRATGNVLLDRLFGAKIVWVEHSERDRALKRAYSDALAEGKQPYLVPYGGSSPIGAAGYALALQELLDQGLQPDWIVFASSSGGTQAGLVAGGRLLGYSGQILGISVDEAAPVLQARIADLAGQTIRLLGTPVDFQAEAMQVNADYIGAGYGVAADPEREALELFGSLEGLALDPVYTGRAAAGMIDLVRKGFFRKEEVVLFWHTGGGPALFADRYQDFLQDSLA